MKATCYLQRSGGGEEGSWIEGGLAEVGDERMRGRWREGEKERKGNKCGMRNWVGGELGFF